MDKILSSILKSNYSFEIKYKIIKKLFQQVNIDFLENEKEIEILLKFMEENCWNENNLQDILKWKILLKILKLVFKKNPQYFWNYFSKEKLYNYFLILNNISLEFISFKLNILSIIIILFSKTFITDIFFYGNNLFFYYIFMVLEKKEFILDIIENFFQKITKQIYQFPHFLQV